VKLKLNIQNEAQPNLRQDPADNRKHNDHEAFGASLTDTQG